jgi:putative transcriptional regulator
MSKTFTTAKIRSDGTVVEIREDGTKQPFPEASMAPMTPEAVVVAAAADPHARPFSEHALQEVRRIAQVKTLRRTLGLTQDEFSTRYHVGTLRDWEQGRTEPDQPARAYLKVIACDPDRVRRALEGKKERK